MSERCRRLTFYRLGGRQPTVRKSVRRSPHPSHHNVHTLPSPPPLPTRFRRPFIRPSHSHTNPFLLQRRKPWAHRITGNRLFFGNPQAFGFLGQRITSLRSSTTRGCIFDVVTHHAQQPHIER